MLAGMAAGAAASLTRVPTEVVKQRLQTGEFKGAVSAVSHGHITQHWRLLVVATSMTMQIAS